MGGKEGGKRKSRYNAQGMIGVSYWVFSRAGREGGGRGGGREGGGCRCIGRMCASVDSDFNETLDM